MKIRTTAEVLDDHLRESQSGSLDDDLARNYSDDIVFLTSFGIYRGHSGVREAAELLNRQLPGARFTYRFKATDGEVGLLVWDAEADAVVVEDGVDSYVVREGRIRVQTIHYKVRQRRRGG